MKLCVTAIGISLLICQPLAATANGYVAPGVNQDSQKADMMPGQDLQPIEVQARDLGARILDPRDQLRNAMLSMNISAVDLRWMVEFGYIQSKRTRHRIGPRRFNFDEVTPKRLKEGLAQFHRDIGHPQNDRLTSEQSRFLADAAKYWGFQRPEDRNGFGANRKQGREFMPTPLVLHVPAPKPQWQPRFFANNPPGLVPGYENWKN